MDINYRDQVISVDHRGSFEITWNESITHEVKQSLDGFDTLWEAKDVIDSKLRLLAKKEPLNLAALSREGIPVTITGIHLGTRVILTKPALDRDLPGRIYLDHPHIREQLARIKAIQEESTAIMDEISVYRIETSYGYGRMEVEEYEGYIKQLKESYAAAQAWIKESTTDKLS